MIDELEDEDDEIGPFEDHWLWLGAMLAALAILGFFSDWIF